MKVTLIREVDRMTHLACIILALLLTLGVSAAEISGRVYIKAPMEKGLVVGYVGLPDQGEQISNMAGLSLIDSAALVTCTTYDPRNTSISWEPNAWATYTHVGLPPGQYLVYARYDDIYYDWQVVEVVSNNAKNSVNFSVNTARTGNLTIDIIRPGKEFDVRIVPYGEDKQHPLPGADIGFALCNSIEVTDQTAELQGLREGMYLLELRAADRQTSDDGSSWAVLTDIGSWVIRVEKGKTLTYKVP